MKITTILFASISFCLLFSCTKDFNISESGDNVVVNSLFNNKEALSVSIQKSYFNIGEINIEDRAENKVSIYGNGQFIEALTYRKTEEEINGQFYANLKPEVGIEYTLKVEDEVLGTAEASAIIPTPTPIRTAIVTQKPWLDENGSEVLDASNLQFNFEFTIADSPAENYYFLRLGIPVYKLDDGVIGDLYGFNIVKMISEDIQSGQSYLDLGYIFNDTPFNGQNFTISGIAQASKYSDMLFTKAKISNRRDDQVFVDTSNLIIHLETLSKEVYQFYTTHATYIQNLEDEFIEPALIYSNVENGLGFFGGVGLTESVVRVE